MVLYFSATGNSAYVAKRIASNLGMGGAGPHAKALSDRLGLNDKGCVPVMMPENYIARYDAPDEEEAIRIIDASEKTIDSIAEKIKSAENLVYSGGNQGNQVSENTDASRTFSMVWGLAA